MFVFVYNRLQWSFIVNTAAAIFMALKRKNTK